MSTGIHQHCRQKFISSARDVRQLHEDVFQRAPSFGNIRITQSMERESSRRPAAAISETSDRRRGPGITAGHYAATSSSPQRLRCTMSEDRFHHKETSPVILDRGRTTHVNHRMETSRASSRSKNVPFKSKFQRTSDMEITTDSDSDDYEYYQSRRRRIQRNYSPDAAARHIRGRSTHSRSPVTVRTSNTTDKIFVDNGPRKLRASSLSKLDHLNRLEPLTVPDFKIQQPKRYVKAASVSRLTDVRHAPDGNHIYPGRDTNHRYPRKKVRIITCANTPRASSLSKIETVKVETPRKIRASSVSHFDSKSYVNSSPIYENVSSVKDMSFVDSIPVTGTNTARLIVDEQDISNYVLVPGEFHPNDVKVSVLPSGKKAVTYTQFSQKGFGDQRMANLEIDKIIQRTKHLQEAMHTLENFIKRNRSLFPEDLIIYQHIVFYLLDEEELRRLGEPPDAEIYGVKIREKLIVPRGSDAADVLRRYYKKHKEIEVEYEETETIRRRLAEEAEGQHHPSAVPIRRRHRVEEDEDDDYVMRRRRVVSPVRRRKDGLYIDEDEMMSVSRRKKAQIGPQFASRLRSKRTDAGQTVRFNCSVSGEPEPKISWFLNGKPIIENGRFRISNNYGLCSLEIISAQPSDAGIYTVKAVNSEGETSCSASLEVEEIIDTRQQSKPRFVVEAFNTSADVGQRAVFEARVYGKPMPQCRWQKDHCNLLEDNRVRSISDLDGNSKLVIRDVMPSDAGVYFCIAENTEGKAKCAATLRVTEPKQFNQRIPRPLLRDISPVRDYHRNVIYDDLEQPYYRSPYPSQDNDRKAKGHKPQFVKLPPTEITVTEGDPLTLRCVVEGHPKATVTWFKGVRELTYSTRHRVLAEAENHHMMQIRSTLQTDHGEYVMVADNISGTTTFSVWVNVLPRPPEDEEERERRELPEYEYELKKKMQEGKMAPMFIRKLPREKEINMGSTIEVKCQIDEASRRQYLVGVDVITREKTKNGAVEPASSNEDYSRQTNKNMADITGTGPSAEPVMKQQTEKAAAEPLDEPSAEKADQKSINGSLMSSELEKQGNQQSGVEVKDDTSRKAEGRSTEKKAREENLPVRQVEEKQTSSLAEKSPQDGAKTTISIDAEIAVASSSHADVSFASDSSSESEFLTESESEEDD